MNRFWKRLVLAVAAVAVAVALAGAFMPGCVFRRAWSRAEDAHYDHLPRTVTNIVDGIFRKAVAAERWPDAARAFIVREEEMSELSDEQVADWLPKFAASVDEQPAQLQAVLQLHLARTYRKYSRQYGWGNASPTKLDDAAAKDKMPPWSPEKIAATLEAQFAKVFAHEAELKSQKMSDWESIFDCGTIPESCCPTLFDFAVYDAVSFYGETIPDKTLEKGFALYDKLIEFHKADGNVDALAMAELERAEYVHDFDRKPEAERDYSFYVFLDGFVKRWDGKTEVVAIAAAKLAAIVRGSRKRGHVDCEPDPEGAHDLAAKYAAKWPGTLGGKLCGNIVADIEEKYLSIDVERNWWTPWPEVWGKARNLDEVHFRMVPVSFDEIIADNFDTSEVTRDRCLLRAPVKEWVEKLLPSLPYDEQVLCSSVPQVLPSGHYLLFAASNGKFGEDGLPLFARQVTVTSLALVLENGNGEFKGTVYRAESGEPVEGATVELWGRPDMGWKYVLRETYTTDKDGRFVADVSKGDNGSLFRRVRVVKDGEEVLSLGNEDSGSRRVDVPEYDHLDIFTDRALYRPGQEIKVKGIAYRANPYTRNFFTHRDADVCVKLSDPNGKEVASQRIKTNKWGSFTHSFAAPEGNVTGEYTVMVQGPDFSMERRKVRVEEYKRPKFWAELEKASQDARLGAPVAIAGRATTYSGLPVQNAKVEWRVERTARCPEWWLQSAVLLDDVDGKGLVAMGEAETDENGVFKVTFTPDTPPGWPAPGDCCLVGPSFCFAVTATVTDGTGEARTARRSFEIGTVAWRANVCVDGEWHTPGKPVEVKVSLASLSGEEVPVKGTLEVVRLRDPERPWRKSADLRYCDSNDRTFGCKNWSAGETVASIKIDEEAGRAVSPQSADMSWKGTLNLGVGAYRLDFSTRDPNGMPVRDERYILVFDPSADALGIKVPDFFRVDKTTVKVGETLRAYWGTGYDTGCCRVKVTSNGKVILEDWVGRAARDGGALGDRALPLGGSVGADHRAARDGGALGDRALPLGGSVGADHRAARWYYELPVKDEYRGEIRIETTFVRENRLYTHCETVNVPWDNKQLEITAERMASRISPGSREKWTFKVSGPAEVLAFMYDRSLDAYMRHDVSLDFPRYFTPSTRWPVLPFFQNTTAELRLLGGIFPQGRRWKTWLVKPYWKDVGLASAPESGYDCAMFCVSDGAPPDDGAATAGIDEEAGESLPDEGAAPRELPRRNLQETAFFYPNIETDADGKVTLEFTVPDALTGWKLLMVAHDNELNGGVYRNAEIVTTRPLMCEPNAPRFVRDGDEFLFPVKVTNNDNTPQKGEVELELEEMVGSARRADRGGALGDRALPLGDSVGADHRAARGGVRISPERSEHCEAMSLEGCAPALPAPQPFSLAPHESRVFEFKVAIPDGCGYLKYVAKAKGEKFADGEEGVLPVLSRRILVREAVQLNARGNETKSFRLDNLLASKGSDTIRHNDLTVLAVSRPAWYAVLSLPYLMEFPHECCEQTFSRYYANALGEFIANSDPRIRETFNAWKAAGAECLKSPLEADPHLKAIALEATPWVREAGHETAARARLGELFGSGRLKDEQERCLVKLQQALGGDGLWPWFPGGRSCNGISLYILAGFARLNHIAGTAYPDFFKSAVDALDESISCNVKFRHEKERLPFRLNALDVRWLYLHSFRGVPPAKDKALVSLFVDRLGKEWQDLGLEAQALAAISLKRMGEEKLAKKIMASIKERGVVSDELGMYWKGADAFSSGVFDAPVSTQALIIEAFREVTGDEESADACSVWLLKQKQTQDWTTTAATADAIYALLLGGGALGDRALPLGDSVGADHRAARGGGAPRGLAPPLGDSVGADHRAARDGGALGDRALPKTDADGNGDSVGADHRAARDGGALGDRALPLGDALAEVTLGGKKVVPEKSEKGTGMWSVRYAADAIKPEMGEIAFTGAGEKDVSWGGVQWSYFEDVQKVRAHEPKELRVEKKYYKKVHGPDGARLTAIEGVLEPGDEIVARLEITSDREYEFVHLSDERPACAEPVDVLSSYRHLLLAQYGYYLGYYQSTKDVATHYYIDSLGKGTFVIETSYRVQQRGVFTGGLATIQCMYAPEFTAHSSAETVRVESK